MFSEVKKCRICHSDQLEKYIDLGKLPLANNIVEPDKKTEDPLFPLEVLLCANCKLSQLSVIVDPSILFSEYAYRTSISEIFQKHFAGLAEEVKTFFSEPQHTLVVDIASNDGCMLQQFKKQGFKVLGVDPAVNLAKIAEEKGISTVVDFWSEVVAENILKEKGKAQVIAASNVFAHVDDVHSFLKGVTILLDENGIFITEFPYALHFIKKTEFDTIYHEHLSYFLVKPLIGLFESEGMKIFNIENISIHGGSIRVFAKHKENTSLAVKKENIQSFLDAEERNNLYHLEPYAAFAKRAAEVKVTFTKLLTELKKEGKKIAGYGAAAKASTLLNYCGIGTELVDFIIDDAPTKQGKAFAGNRVPIVSSAILEKEHPDFLILFAWTIAKELIEKTKSFQEKGGQYILPLPFPKIIKNETEL